MASNQAAYTAYTARGGAIEAPEELATDKDAKAWPTPAEGYSLVPDAKVPGLALRVTAKGARSWVLSYRNSQRRQHRLTIGSLADWPIAAARKRANKLRQAIDTGSDPVEEQRAENEAKTIADVLDDHVTRYARKEGLRSADEIERTFNRLVKPRLGNLGLHELRRSHVVQMLDEIEDQNGAVMADRTLAYLRKALNWQATRDDDFNSPIVRGMARTKPKERARTRTLADDEIRDVWAALDKVAEPAPYARFVRSLLLTAQRRGELLAMEWPEIEKGEKGDIWIIPASRYKTKIENVVPLSKSARDVIGTKPDKSGSFVFTTTGGEKPFDASGKAKATLDAAIAELRQERGATPMPHWTLHDLRRTARSLMSRAGVAGDIGERVLGHVIPGVRGTYDRYAYLAEKQDALNRLAALVERILHPPAANVEEFPARKARRGAQRRPGA